MYTSSDLGQIYFYLFKMEILLYGVKHLALCTGGYVPFIGFGVWVEWGGDRIGGVGMMDDTGTPGYWGWWG